MGDGEDEGFAIGDLAMRAGVTPRTVRYYVAERLLPPPRGAGQNRLYGEEHLLRLRAIRRLKDAYLPLDEIRRRLGALSPEQLRRIGELGAGPATLPGAGGSAERGSSALEYLDAVLGTPGSVRPRPPAAAAPESATPESGPAGEAWRRVELAPGVELQYREAGDPARAARIARLIEEGRRLLGSAGRWDTSDDE